MHKLYWQISEDLMIIPFEEAPPLQRAKQGKERVLLTIEYVEHFHAPRFKS